MSNNLDRAGLFGMGILCLCVAFGCKSPVQSNGKSAKSSPMTAAKPVQPARQGNSEVLAKAAQVPSLPFDGEGWKSLFDGKTLTGWRETDFGGRGETFCTNDMLVMNQGDPFTGVNLKSPFPKMNYELALDAMRVDGSDFFCGITMPVGENFCSLIVGGWGGSLLGISSLDSMDASENETTRFLNFERGKWYRIRVRITEGRIETWLDKEKMVDVVTTDRKISLRPGEIEMSKPFGICCWQTTSALREIKVRPVTAAADPPKKH